MRQKLASNPACNRHPNRCEWGLIGFWAIAMFAAFGSWNWLRGSESNSPSSDATDVETTILMFDELVADQIMGNAVGRYPADLFHKKHQLWIGTCQASGTPEVGKTIQLERPEAMFEVVGGRNQPYISAQNILVAFGGEKSDLLLTFEQPVTSVSIVSDRYPESADVIRLMILEPVKSDGQRGAPEAMPARQSACRVLAIDSKLDDAVAEPDNVLSVDLRGKPFQHVLIECTTEMEGFDNLKFTRAKQVDQVQAAASTVIFDWKQIRETLTQAPLDEKPKGVSSPRDKAQRILENQVDLARFHGWQAVKAVVPKLDSADKQRYPGIAALVADVTLFENAHDRKFPPHEWPAEESDQLLLKNPHFWQAMFEVTPGDSSLTVAHIGMLSTLGELDQAFNMLQLTRHDDSIPVENRQRLQQILFAIINMKMSAGRAIQTGNKSYDEGRYEAAAAEYQKVLDVWPRCSAAHYELEQTLQRKDRTGSGGYARSRRANPLLKEAFQGTYTSAEHEQRRKIFPLVERWNDQIVKSKSASSEVLLGFAKDFQDVAILENHFHELALFTRQIVIARNGNYAKDDREFITASLKELIPASNAAAIATSLENPIDDRLTIFPRVKVEPQPPAVPKAP